MRVRARVERSVRCTAALLLTGAAALSAHRATLVPRLRDPAVYFACEGVEGDSPTLTLILTLILTPTHPQPQP